MAFLDDFERGFVKVPSNLLLWLLITPLIGAGLCLLLSAQIAKYVALTTSLVGVVLAVVLYQNFNPALSQQLQLIYSLPWIQSYQIYFSLGIDGLSYPLILLTKFMMPIAILASFNETKRVKLFMFCFLLLDVAMTGTFLATDIFLFYIFWEMMLIPMLLLIGIWGGTEKIRASVKFFIFTFAGSIFMLVSILYIYGAYQNQFGVSSSEIQNFYKLTFSHAPVLWGLSIQDWVFLGFTVAFIIKVPLFPFHTWLPDAHVQAPTGGSVILAAVLLKMGAYGLLRFSIPIAPEAFLRFNTLLAALSLIGIIYGAWVAYQQTDMKKMVAYSSVSHLGFVVLAICSLDSTALSGAVLQMVNHGLSTGALFILVGILYERRHTKKLSDFGGLASVVPWFSFLLVFSACSSMAVPGLNGFVGEFLILIGTFQNEPLWATIAVLGVVFGALYMLSMLKQVLYGPITHSENHAIKDIQLKEWFSLLPLCILMLLLGFAPNLLISQYRSTTDNYWNQHLKKPILDSRVSIKGKKA